MIAPVEGAPPEIRPAQRADLGALSPIWLDMMEQHARTSPTFALAPGCQARWQEMTLELMARSDAFVLVACHGGPAVGFCLGWVARNPAIYAQHEVGFISEMAVAAGARRRGVGRCLLAAARVWFGAREIHQFQLSTAVFNDTARQFWAAQGGRPLLLRYCFDV